MISFFLIFSLLVCFHELGHYLIAKKNGVKIEVFSVGFGPRLFSWTDRSGTVWKISAFPLGGYVRMVSDSSNFVVENNYREGDHKKSASYKKSDSLSKKSIGVRVAVSVAGPLANYGLAILIFCLLYTLVGRPEPSEPVQVCSVLRWSLASQAGIKSGDIIHSFNGTETPTYKKLRQVIKKNSQWPLLIGIDRNGEKIVLVLPLKKIDPNKEGISVLGIEPETRSSCLSLHKAFYYSFLESFQFSYKTLKSMMYMLIGKQSTEWISGPVGIAALTNEVTKRSFEDLLCLTALLSINLGLINLLPIPTLDGGHLLFYFIEIINGKPLPLIIQRLGYYLGLGFILVIFIIATKNDLTHFGFLQQLQDFLRGAFA